MGMTRRGSPALFAGPNLLVMIICLFISIEMGHAWWPNICTPGDTYIERNHINLPEKCGSSVCYDWCKGQCSSIGRSVAKKNCQDPPPYLDCQCCCDVAAPTPGSPPSPSLPPAPPSPPPSGQWPNGAINTNICAIGQEYVQIKHENINDCALKPQCENKCKEKGLMSGGSQCIGSSRDYKGGAYSWYEQCCCAKIPPPPPPSPPPPPPPSPPPPSPSPPTPCPSPSPGSCCDKDINIKISVKSGGCNAEVSKTASSSTGGTWAEL